MLHDESANDAGERPAATKEKALGEGIDRPSLVAMATVAAGKFGGAEGVMELMHFHAFDPDASPATRAGIIKFLIYLFKETSKLHGDRDKIKNMEKPQIEHRLVQMLVDHGFTVPIPGVSIPQAGPA